ncbi:ThiF family adenylyltransferase [Deinococcus altitudinis]|uniref:ThiF family adenylyltransferase n=1 Tax=Deinococcus altitudinis TaxID=468914 RepID=UPI003892CB20
MTSAAQLEAWLTEFAASATFVKSAVSRPKQSLVWATERGITAVLDLTIPIEGNDVELRIGLTTFFPHVLPFVQLVGDTAGLSEGLTAHVSRNGDICYLPTREAVNDPSNPLGVIHEALSRAMETLLSAWTASDNTEILDEFNAYWQVSARPGSAAVLQAYFTPDDQARTLQLWRASDRLTYSPVSRSVPWRRTTQGRASPAVAVADDIQDINDFSPRTTPEFGPASRTVLYLPLLPTPVLLPPLPNQRWSPDDLRRIVRASLSPENLTRLDNLLEHRRSKSDLIVLGIPRPGREGVGAYELISVQLDGMRDNHVLKPSGGVAGVRLQPGLVQRRDRQLIMQRGGSDDTLSDKRVLLLGCGALGGHLAFGLASAGIGHLTLVDFDVFRLANTFRHVLGRRFVGKSKVSAMGVALRERYPYLHIVPHFERTEALIGAGIDLGTFDLIIDATGNSTHHLTLAGMLKASTGHPPVLLTWLEALGLGGHTLSVFSEKPGCPRCLYSEPSAPLFNVASFSAPGQELGNDTLGCGTYHTPFSDLDAVKTAEMAARQAVAMLKGEDTGNLLRSWKGDERAFVQAGHRLSERFRRAKRKALREGEGFVSSTCSCCGSP